MNREWIHQREIDRAHYQVRANRSREPMFGYGRKSEAAHDALAERIYRDVRMAIERHGDKILAVEKENEIKKRVGRDVRAIGRPLTAHELLQIAEDHGLKVVDGQIRIPDLQLIVKRREGNVEVCNLEASSRHYHRRTIIQKQRAGFVVKGPGIHDHPIRARRALEGPDLVGAILAH